MLHQHKKTITSSPGDFSKWHRGRKEFSIWMIELEHDEVHRKIWAARNHLSGLLLSPYERQPHITLVVCGFLVNERRWYDDYDKSQFDAHCRQLKESKLKPFSIEIHGLDSFASAPFFHVRDCQGGIEQIKALLSTTAIDIDDDRYSPHVTVGLYSGAFDSRIVLERIKAFADEPIRLSVDRITFAAYDASDIRGPLVYKHRVELSKCECIQEVNCTPRTK
ncbi:MAG TPA: 2'-5' RNA ligase family protein [Nitrospirota bacterium]|nr:2'-5' RNA ligase family protein [Nitrospirota bacterium]